MTLNEMKPLGYKNEEERKYIEKELKKKNEEERKYIDLNPLPGSFSNYVKQQKVLC